MARLKERGKHSRQIHEALRFVKLILLAWVIISISLVVFEDIRPRGLWQFKSGFTVNDRVAAFGDGDYWNYYWQALMFYLYSGLQMLFANLDAKDAEHGLNSLLRLIAPWVIPVFAAYAVVESLRTRASLFLKNKTRKLSNRKKPFYLIVGLGEKGWQILNSLRDNNKVGNDLSADVVVLESSDENPYIDAAKNMGVSVWIGNAHNNEDIDICCWKRPDKIWIMTENDIDNLLIFDIIKNRFCNKKSPMPLGSKKVWEWWSNIQNSFHGLLNRLFNRPPRKRLDVYIHIKEPRDKREAATLQALNDDKKEFWSHLINLEEDAAAYLMHRYVVTPSPDDKPPKILVLGMGGLGQAVFKELLMLCNFPIKYYWTEIHTVDNSVSKKDMENKFPFLAKKIKGVTPIIKWQHCCEDVISWVYEDYIRIAGGREFTHVFVMLGSEVRNISLSKRISAWNRMKFDKIIRAVPVVYEVAANDWHKSKNNTSNDGLMPYYLYDAYSKTALEWRDELVDMATWLNSIYQDRSVINKLKAKIKDENKSGYNVVVPELEQALEVKLSQSNPNKNRDEKSNDYWTQLEEVHRRSSLAQVRYQNNLRDYRPTVDQNSWAEAEHRRWNAEKLIDGYDYVDIDEEKYKTYRLAAKVNKNLIRYNNLDEGSKQYDLDFVKSANRHIG